MIITQQMMREARVPRRFYDACGEDYYNNRTALNTVARYLRNLPEHFEKGDGLMFCGETHAGKTYLMCILLKELLIRGIDCLYVTLEEMIELAYNRPIETEDTVLTYKSVLATKVLCVDNIWIPQSKANSDVLRKICAYRRDNLLPLCVATDMTEEQFVAGYDNSVVEFCNRRMYTIECGSK